MRARQGQILPAAVRSGAGRGGGAHRADLARGRRCGARREGCRDRQPVGRRRAECHPLDQICAEQLAARDGTDLRYLAGAGDARFRRPRGQGGSRLAPRKAPARLPAGLAAVTGAPLTRVKSSWHSVENGRTMPGHFAEESMSAHKEYHPEKVRSRLSHPIIDGDGHWIEYGPVFAEQMRKAAGDKAAAGLLRHIRRIPDVLSLSIAERRRRGIAMEGYWGRQSTNTRDRATAMMPRMLYDRLDELGIDFGIIYPTAGLGIPRIADDETRRAVIHGFNIVTADFFAKLSDRLIPAAVIPMHTPEEAIAELEFVTKQLGAKVGMFGSGVRRPLPAAAGIDPGIARHAVLY